MSQVGMTDGLNFDAQQHLGNDQLEENDHFDDQALDNAQQHLENLENGQNLDEQKLEVNHSFEEQKVLRNEGLGLFAVLSDKQIIQLITDNICDQSTSHLVLLALSETSKAFYQISIFEPIWMVMVLNYSKGDFEFDWNWRQTFVNMFLKKQKVSWELYNGTIIPGKVFHLDRLFRMKGFYSEYMYMKWVRGNADLSQFYLGQERIERVERITQEIFDMQFDKPRKPCVITDMTMNWGAREWSVDYLLEKYPDHVFKCVQYNQFKERTKMTMSQLVLYMRQQKDGVPIYLFDPDFAEKIPQLRKDYKIPKYFAQDLLATLYEKRPQYRWFLVGPMRSGSNFHIDPRGTSAWNSLLSGRKRWALYPPNFPPPGVALNIEDDSIVDYQAPNPMKWFYEILPTLPPELRPIEFIQHAGETVYVPAGWWHCVLNLEETVSVTQNFVSENNLKLAVEFLYNGEEFETLELWKKNIRQVRGDLYKMMDTKLKKLKGKEAVMTVPSLEEQVEAQSEELEQLRQELASLSH